MTEEQQQARLDIKYTTTGNKHVIIELKRANRVLTTPDLFGQISKYYDAAEKVLARSVKGNEPIEIICVLGDWPRDWNDAPSSGLRYRESLRSLNARVVTYDQLIENALNAYQEYVDREQEAGRVYDLIQSIEKQDVEAINPPV